MAKPDLSFVVPVLNEGRYLDTTLDSLLRQELGDFTAEVLVLDGGSTDDSTEIVKRYAAKSTRVSFRLVANPRRRTPAAFNIGIAEAAADIIGLGGAHTVYPNNYFRTAIGLIRSGIGDVVGGGHHSHLPSRNSTVARAMACLYQSPMGSGVAAYHRRTDAGFVDTVYGGFYRRDVFDRVGLFDESLSRNQDNELNDRVLRSGMRIYFDPRLSTQYVLKADLKTFLKRGYLFGRYHAETWRRSPGAFRLRHAVPGLFALYLVVALVAGLAWRNWWVAAPLILYFVLLLAAAISLTRSNPLPAALVAIPLFAAYHISYGAGTLVGLLWEIFRFKSPPVPKRTGAVSNS